MVLGSISCNIFSLLGSVHEELNGAITSRLNQLTYKSLGVS